MDAILRDLRYAFRTLGRVPGFTAVAVLTLALGIGANATIYGIVDAVLLRPLPYADADRVVVIWNSYQSLGLSRAALSPAEYADYAERGREFSGLAALADQHVNLTGRGEPQRAQAFVVSPAFFRVLGVSPALGRDFLPEEGAEGADRVAVLSDALWRGTFGADPRVVGSTVRLNGVPHTVVGVAPRGVRFPDAPGFMFPERADLWVPFAWERRRAEPRGDQFLRLIARVRPGAGPEQAQAALDRIAPGLRAQYPDTYRAGYSWRPVAVPLVEQIVGDVRPSLLVLLAATAAVLLIACVNTANLALARAASRRREIAVRTALGASRWSLVRTLLAESLLLSVAGGGLGLLLAAWGVDLIVRLGPADIPRLEHAGVGLRLVGFTFAASLCTAALFGIAPALASSRQGRPRGSGGGLAEGLRDAGDRSAGGQGGGGRRAARLRSALVVAEVSLSLLVLVGAGLLVRSFERLQRVDPGFATDAAAHTLTFQLALPVAKYDSEPRVTAFYDAAIERLAALPGVQAAAAVTPLPLSGDGWGGSFVVEEQPVPAGGTFPHGEYAAVTPDYFRALGIPLRAGRTFAARDTRSAPEVAVIDETLARTYWPGLTMDQVVGKRLNLAGRPDSAWATVVGVVGHVRSGALHEAGEPQIYLPHAQRQPWAMYVAVRTSGGAAALVRPVRAAIRGLDADVPVAKVRTMADLLAASAARRRFNLLLLSVFAAASLALAAVGIYGVTAYAVAQRTREIGIRLALGAHPARLRRSVLAGAMRLALAGAGVGMAAALPGAHAVRGMLYATSPTDPLVLAGVALLVVMVAALASWVPARRASRVDPLVAMRGE